ncbi:MAG: acyl-CoA dehydrogenase, partial [Salinibacterium sp.]
MSEPVEGGAQAPDAEFPGTPQVDVAALGEQLMGHWASVRRHARELVARPELRRIEGLSMQEHRARVLKQLHILVKEGAVHRAFPKELGGGSDHG